MHEKRIALARERVCTAAEFVDDGIIRTLAEERDRLAAQVAALQQGVREMVDRHRRDIESGEAMRETLAAQVAELAAATNGLIEVMAMQEQRETGAFHLSAGSALAIWNDAKDKAMAALAKVRT